MTKPIMLIVNLPFPGFYESHYSAAIDWEEERYCEDVASESDHETDEPQWPESLRLDSSELAELLLRVTDYRAAYEQLARDYVAAFDALAGETFGLSVAATRNRYDWQTKEFVVESYRRPSIRATFESMDSPREYNFRTDRLYAEIPLAVMRLLFKRSKAESHATLAAVIRERFTSCDGFISFYPNRLADWLEKPLQDWDHNELGILMIAGMRQAGADPDSNETCNTLYDGTVGDEGAYSAWESAVDWPAFDAKRLEARAEKLAEWLADDPDSALAWREKKQADFAVIVAADPGLFQTLELPDLPYRCPATVDMFTGLPG